MLRDLKKQFKSAYRSHVLVVCAHPSTAGIDTLILAPSYRGARGDDGSGTCQSCNDSTGRPPKDNPIGK